MSDSPDQQPAAAAEPAPETSLAPGGVFSGGKPSEAPLTQTPWTTMIRDWPDRETVRWLLDSEGRAEEREKNEVERAFHEAQARAFELTARHARRPGTELATVPA